jgi:hypothetical protein
VGQALHHVLTFIFHSLMEVPTVCFAVSSCTVCLKVLLSVLLFPRCNRSFRPWSFMPLLHYGCARCLFLNVCPFEVPLATLSVPGPWQPCPLHDAEMARWVFLLEPCCVQLARYCVHVGFLPLFPFLTPSPPCVYLFFPFLPNIHLECSIVT